MYCISRREAPFPKKSAPGEPDTTEYGERILKTETVTTTQQCQLLESLLTVHLLLSNFNDDCDISPAYK